MASVAALPLERRLRPPGSPRQVVSVESLPDERFDDGLAAHVEIGRSLIEFLQHARGEIYVHPLNRLNHAPFALEEAGNVLPFLG